jgi:hypothetical protein
MKKKILITGCSHVAGHGFEDNIDGAGHSKYAWPAIIQRNYDVEVIDLSTGGASAPSCIEGVQTFNFKKSLSAIMVMLPDSSRTLQKISQNGRVEDQNYHYNYIAIDVRWNKIMSAYQKVCHNPRVETINMLSYAGYLKYISTTYNIPLWLTVSSSNDYEFLLKNNIQLSTPIDWVTYCGDRGFPRLPDGHWGHETHQTFYQEFINPWLHEKIG